MASRDSEVTFGRGPRRGGDEGSLGEELRKEGQRRSLSTKAGISFDNDIVNDVYSNHLIASPPVGATNKHMSFRDDCICGVNLQNQQPSAPISSPEFRMTYGKYPIFVTVIVEEEYLTVSG